MPSWRGDACTGDARTYCVSLTWMPGPALCFTWVPRAGLPGGAQCPPHIVTQEETLLAGAGTLSLAVGAPEADSGSTEDKGPGREGAVLLTGLSGCLRGVHQPRRPHVHCLHSVTQSGYPCPLSFWPTSALSAWRPSSPATSVHYLLGVYLAQRPHAPMSNPGVAGEQGNRGVGEAGILGSRDFGDQEFLGAGSRLLGSRKQGSGEQGAGIWGERFWGAEILGSRDSW